MWIGETRVTITDPERTLLDGLAMPRYCGDFAEVLHAFEARGTDLELQRIIEYALKLDAAPILGTVFERVSSRCSSNSSVANQAAQSGTRPAGGKSLSGSGSARRPRWAAALDQGYSSARSTSPARTGLRST